MSAYKKESCGCEHGPDYEPPPGIAFGLRNPDAATEYGWVHVSDDDRSLFLKPCAMHRAYGVVCHNEGFDAGLCK